MSKVVSDSKSLNDISKLSDYQLYEIIANTSLDDIMRDAANNEFNRRNIDKERIEQIVVEYDQRFVPQPQAGLKLRYKILLILIPFAIDWPILAFVNGRLLRNGVSKKWKDYWLFIGLGFLFWTILIIVLVRLFGFNT